MHAGVLPTPPTSQPRLLSWLLRPADTRYCSNAAEWCAGRCGWRVRWRGAAPSGRRSARVLKASISANEKSTRDSVPSIIARRRAISFWISGWGVTSAGMCVRPLATAWSVSRGKPVGYCSSSVPRSSCGAYSATTRLDAAGGCNACVLRAAAVYAWGAMASAAHAPQLRPACGRECGRRCHAAYVGLACVAVCCCSGF